MKSEFVHHPERLGVPFKPFSQTAFFHQVVKFRFSDVTKRRVSQVVRQSCCFGYVCIELKCLGKITLISKQPLCHPPCDLCHFKRMSKPIVEDMPLVGRHHLCNAGQAAKSRRVQDSVSISLRRIAIIGWLIRMEPLVALPGRGRRFGDRSLQGCS